MGIRYVRGAQPSVYIIYRFVMLSAVIGSRPVSLVVRTSGFEIRARATETLFHPAAQLLGVSLHVLHPHAFEDVNGHALNFGLGIISVVELIKPRFPHVESAGRNSGKPCLYGSLFPSFVAHPAGIFTEKRDLTLIHPEKLRMVLREQTSRILNCHYNRTP